MRVLYFSRDYTTHDRRFLEKLAGSRHDVYYLRLEDDGIPYENRPLPGAVRCIEWRGGRERANDVTSWLRLMSSFESVLDRVRPNLVHAGPVQSCAFMTALAGFRPLLIQSWGSDLLVDADRDEMWQWITVYALNRSDWLFCDCAAVRKKALQMVFYPDEKIIQFPWGVDLECFHPGDADVKLKTDNDPAHEFVILATRTWEQIYGIDVMLEAFQKAHAQEPGLRLVLAGTGSLASYVEGFLAKHRLENAVRRPGVVSQEKLPDVFRSADLYLSCSYSDGTSISLLEAMATGLPVVVTESPVNREWIIPGENGWLAPAGDSESFARLLLEASSLEKARRDQIGRKNREIAEKRASWHENSDMLLNAYDEMALQVTPTDSC